ncbi:hypothetical protein ACYSNM_13000 [Myroides sp. LJL116]
MKYEKWGLSEKLSILQESEEIGVIEICSKLSLIQVLITHGRRNLTLRENQD